MVTAPVMVVLHDLALRGRPGRDVVRERGRFYAALAGTWAVLAAILAGGAQVRGALGGVGKISSFEYLRLQARAIVHYLRLAVWPHPLAIAYDWGPSRDSCTPCPSAWSCWRCSARRCGPFARAGPGSAFWAPGSSSSWPRPRACSPSTPSRSPSGACTCPGRGGGAGGWCSARPWPPGPAARRARSSPSRRRRSRLAVTALGSCVAASATTAPSSRSGRTRCEGAAQHGRAQQPGQGVGVGRQHGQGARALPRGGPHRPRTSARALQHRLHARPPGKPRRRSHTCRRPYASARRTPTPSTSWGWRSPPAGAPKPSGTSRRAWRSARDAEVHRELANALAADGRPPEAAGHHFEESLRLGPDDFRAHSKYGNAADSLGDSRGGARYGRRCASSRRTRARATTWPRRSCRLGRAPEAVDELERALRDDPRYAIGHYNLANILARRRPRHRGRAALPGDDPLRRAGRGASARRAAEQKLAALAAGRRRRRKP